jgi:hypothetical protein
MQYVYNVILNNKHVHIYGFILFKTICENKRKDYLLEQVTKLRRWQHTPVTVRCVAFS